MSLFATHQTSEPHSRHICCAPWLSLLRVTGVHGAIPIAPAQAHSQVSSATGRMHWHCRSTQCSQRHQHYRSRPSQKRTPPKMPPSSSGTSTKHVSVTADELGCMQSTQACRQLHCRCEEYQCTGESACSSGPGGQRAASVAKSTGRWNEPHTRRQRPYTTRKPVVHSRQQADHFRDNLG